MSSSASAAETSGAPKPKQVAALDQSLSDKELVDRTKRLSIATAPEPEAPASKESPPDERPTADESVRDQDDSKDSLSDDETSKDPGDWAGGDVLTTNMDCLLCKLDLTVPNEMREKRDYTLAELDQHMQSKFHTRKEQVRRAFEHGLKAAGKVSCKSCENVKFSAWEEYEVHVQELHPDVLKPRSELEG